LASVSSGVIPPCFENTRNMGQGPLSPTVQHMSDSHFPAHGPAQMFKLSRKSLNPHKVITKDNTQLLDVLEKVKGMDVISLLDKV
jgi:hypothetical protein